MGEFMNWNEGYSAQYILTEVDPATWRDTSTIDITGGNVSRGTSGLMESADVDTTENLKEKWVRIWVIANQNDDGGRSALFTGLLQTPATKWDGTYDTYSAACYSVLKPCADVYLPRGWYVLAGTNGAEAVARLLSVSPAPIEFEDFAPNLTETLIAEDNETNLSMAWKILNAMGWRLRITGYGNIQILPKATEPALYLDSEENDIVEMDVTDSQDLYSCPNVFRAISGDLTAIARDEDDNSPLSIQARGREIWAQDTNVSLNTGESISDYAKRRLEELQSPARIINYPRRYIPDVYPGDIVSIRNAEQNIIGKFRINTQKIELGYGARTIEEAEYIKEPAEKPKVYGRSALAGVVGVGIVGLAIVGRSTTS